MYNESAVSGPTHWLLPLSLNQRLDRIGATASGACAVHCAALPFVAGVLPLLGLGVLASEAFELTFIALALSLAGLSMASGWRRHRAPAPAIWLAIGAMMFAIGTLSPAHHHPIWHAVFLVAGGLSLCIAHLRNLRLLRGCGIPKS